MTAAEFIGWLAWLADLAWATLVIALVILWIVVRAFFEGFGQGLGNAAAKRIITRFDDDDPPAS